ncbi:hypothetical protein P7K49_039268 [Saguinus oedipus]|uniref:Uncharacterized protein n=1 Tax=Saguinus oedipus TaxID=9490 RepID=A0ABQ9TH01_SAGOE|nr:hypothetical protein P7K49_039268 [Saguinus oedipus]
MKAKKTKLEGDKLCLKEVPDASESHTVKLELQRPSLEGELQRSCLVLRNLEAPGPGPPKSGGLPAETGSRQQAERLNRALAQVEESEGARRVKVPGLTEALSQSSASLNSPQEENLHLQKALTACEHECPSAPEMAGHCWAGIWQEGKAAALHTVQKLQDKWRLLWERLGSRQCALAQLEAEKREVECSALKKDLVALRRTLDKRRAAWTELKLTKAQRQIQKLEAQVVALEQSHSPAQLEVEAQQQLELQQEVEACAVPRHRLNTP